MAVRDSAGNIIIAEQIGQHTYNVNGIGLTPAATPTDIIVLRGSANKIIQPLAMNFRVNSTAAVLSLVRWIKRTALNAGGTLDVAPPVPSKYDSLSPDPTAGIDIYTANPATLGAGKTIGFQTALTATLTAVPTLWAMSTGGVILGSKATISQPSVLRGAAECLAINWNAVAWPANGVFQYDITWAEYEN